MLYKFISKKEESQDTRDNEKRTIARVARGIYAVKSRQFGAGCLMSTLVPRRGNSQWVTMQTTTLYVDPPRLWLWGTRAERTTITLSLQLRNPTREAKLELCIGAALSLCCRPSDYHKHLAGLVPE